MRKMLVPLVALLFAGFAEAPKSPRGRKSPDTNPYTRKDPLARLKTMGLSDPDGEQLRRSPSGKIRKDGGAPRDRKSRSRDHAGGGFARAAGAGRARSKTPPTSPHLKPRALSGEPAKKSREEQRRAGKLQPRRLDFLNVDEPSKTAPLS